MIEIHNNVDYFHQWPKFVNTSARKYGAADGINPPDKAHKRISGRMYKVRPGEYTFFQHFSFKIVIAQNQKEYSDICIIHEKNTTLVVRANISQSENFLT